MGLLRYILGDWKNVGSLYVYTCTDHGNSVQVDAYKATIDEHRDTGERRVDRGKHVDTQIQENASCSGAPPVIKLTSPFGSDPLYKQSYVENNYDKFVSA